MDLQPVIETDATTRQNAIHNVEEMSFFDVLLILVRERVLIAKIVGFAIVLTGVVLLILPNMYTGTVKVMPPERRKSIAASLLESTGLGQLAAAEVGFADPNEIYLSMLKTDRVTDAIIQRFDLGKSYKETDHWKLRKKVKKNLHVASGNDTLITLEFDDKDPSRAAAIANAYAEELDKVTQELASGEASHRRTFFESQLRKAKDDLNAAEDAMRKVQESSGIVQLDMQTKSIIEQTAVLNGRISAKEVELSRLRGRSTEQNSQVRNAERELATMREQLSRLENRSKTESGGLQVPAGKVPAVSIEYIRAFRDFKYYESVYEALGKQYQIAHLDESNTAPIVQVLEAAKIPERKSSPQRALILIAVAVTSLFLAIFWVLGTRVFQLFLLRNPKQADKWRQLSTMMKTGRERGFSAGAS